MTRSALGVAAFLTAGVIAYRVALADPPRVTHGVRIEGLRVGFDGGYKLGRWTPIEVVLGGAKQAIAGRLELVLPDGDGVLSRVLTPPAPPVRLAPGPPSRVELYGMFGRVQSNLTVRFRSSDGALVQRNFEAGLSEKSSRFPQALASEAELFVTVGPSVGIERALRFSSEEEGDRSRWVELPDTSELPRQWYGYDAVDALVFATSRPRAFKAFAPDGEQFAALDQWLQSGGRLILCVGNAASELWEDGQSAIARLAPGALEGVVSLGVTRALENYSGASIPIRLPSSAARGDGPIRACRLSAHEGYVELSEADLPLVVRTPRAFGEVVFVAVDLDQPPLANWKGRAAFLNALLGRPSRHTDATQSLADDAGAVSQLGITDLSGQLRQALDQFPGVQPVPFWVVVSLAVVYIAVIGPLDYWFVRRVLKRMEFTWISFPAVVILSSAAAYAMASWLKGDRLLARQAELVDFDLDSRRVRGTSWLAVFSPRMRAYDVRIEPIKDGAVGTAGRARSGTQRDRSSALVSWLGMPGESFGGMSAVAAPPLAWGTPYEFGASLDYLSGVPIPIWSTKHFLARWNRGGTAPLRADLHGDPIGGLTGSLTSEMDQPLEDCLLAYGGWAYPLSTIAPRASLEIGPFLQQRRLETHLKRPRMVHDPAKNQYLQVSTPYDRASDDVGLILQQMMFYRIAKAQAYTRLFHRYQPHVDLSHQLVMGRAILLGRVPRAATAVKIDGHRIPDPQTKRDTFYRFILPVKPPTTNH